MSLIEIPVDYLEARIIELLSNTKPPVNRREIMSKLISEGFNVTESRLYKIFNIIRSKWRPIAQINMYSLGLRDLVLVLKKLPENIYTSYLTFQSQLGSRGVLLIYRLPFKVSITEVLSYYSEDILEDYAVIVYKRRASPLLLRYYFNGWIRVKFLEELNKVFSKLRGLRDISVDKSLKRFSLLDLLIINYLEYDAFNSARDIARRINVRYDKVLRRIVSIRKQGIVEGIGVGIFDVEPLHRDTKLLVIGNLGGLYPHHRLAIELSRIPGLGSIGIDTITDKIVLFIPSKHVEYTDLINSLRRHLIDTKVYEIDVAHSVLYRVPGVYKQSVQEYIGTWLEFTTESRT